MGLDRPLRVISMPVDDGGCGYYRIRQPFSMIKHHTEHDSHVVDPKKDDMILVAEAVSNSDIVVVRQGTPLKATRREIGRALVEMGKELKTDFPMNAKWVLDIDDNMEMISPYSEHYSEYGVEEYTYPDTGVKVWEDGKTFDLEHNRRRLFQHLQDMRDADMITVTTPKLADYARKYNKRVEILPNLIDTSVWWPLPLKPSKRLKIGWSGGVSHYEDFDPIRDALNDVLERFDVELVMVGAHFPGLIQPELRHKVTVLPWVPFAAHSYRMMCLGLDIAIVPLNDLPFNHYKSPIKFLEFAAMGVPALVANVTPYKEVVEHNQTALAYDNAAQFKTGLLALVTNSQLRTRLGNAAREAVLKQYDAARNAHLWTEAYASLLT